MTCEEKEWYHEYLTTSHIHSFNEDQDICIRLYKEVIAPNDKLYDYLEDKRLTWIDDFPLVNTPLLKMLAKLISEKGTE